jgi:hypothetical protein
MPVPGSPRPKALYVADCALQERWSLNYPFRMATRKAAGRGHGLRGRSPPGHVRVCWAGDADRTSASFVPAAGFPLPCPTSCDGVVEPIELVATQQHVPSLPSDQIGEFLAELPERPGIPARGLQFSDPHRHRQGRCHRPEAPRAAAVTGEHIDLAARSWTIPATKKRRRPRMSPTAGAAGLVDTPAREGSWRVIPTTT